MIIYFLWSKIPGKIINLSMVMKKTVLYDYAKSKGAHQPVHPLSLVSSILRTAWIIPYTFILAYTCFHFIDFG